MPEPFDLPFMQRAALEIVLIAPIAGLIGAQIVLRRLSFYTHGVGAASFPGLVLAGPIGVPPVAAALAVAALFSIAIERLARLGRLAYDSATALLLVACLAIGIVLASDVFESGSGVDRLLFGSLLGISGDELATTTVVLLVVLAGAALFRRTWIASGFDGFARSSLRLPVALADWALVTVIALSVVTSLDAVGALLVSGLLVIPAATARLFVTSVLALEVGAGALALVEGLAGLAVAFELDAPPGATIAVLGGVVFAAGLAAKTMATRRGQAVGAGV